MPDPAGLPHHERAIARFTAEAVARGALGVIVVGSAARGTARVDSDVDAYEVVDDAAFMRALDDGRVARVDERAADYPGGYIDIKVISLELLRCAVERADDPTRASLAGARVTHDRTGELPVLAAAIASPPEEYFARSIPPLMAQFALHAEYFLPHGRDRDERVLAAHAALHAGFAAGRIALARAGVLFRGPKYLDEQLRAAGLEKEAEAVATLIDDRSESAVDALSRLIGATRIIDDDTLSRFITDNEWAWFTRTPPPEHR